MHVERKCNYLNFPQCLALPATRSFIDQIFSTSADNQILMIGAGCSVATEPVAELTPFWNIVQVAIYSYSYIVKSNMVHDVICMHGNCKLHKVN